MTANPGVVNELRAMFRKGATPSRLIQHIAEHHGKEEDWAGLVGEYFWKAFSVPLVRVADSREECSCEDLHLAYLNVHLIHQMIENRSEWDRDAKGAAIHEPSWMNSLVATDEVQLIKQAQPASLPEFANSWPHLERTAQDYVQRIMGNANALHERVLILARLTERLQQRIVELEERLGENQ
jgi:hypothetical protein